jgi:hypothetical protein
MSFAMINARKTPAGITRQDLIDGKTFTYSGHFMRIAHKEVKYNAELRKDIEILKKWHYQRGEYLVSADKDDKWLVTGMMEDKFYVFQPSFGKVCILYKECELVEEEAVI